MNTSTYIDVRTNKIEIDQPEKDSNNDNIQDYESIINAEIIEEELIMDDSLNSEYWFESKTSKKRSRKE